MRVYLIRDHGTQPFKVTIDSKNNVKVYKIIDITTSKSKYERHALLKFKPEEIFLPKDTYGETGMTILIRLIDNIYVYIGEKIYGFRSLAPIIDYYSIIYHRDGPYPFAIDNKRNFYLMTLGVILINKKDSLASRLQSIVDWPVYIEGIDEYHDPYNFYYDYIYMTDNVSGNVSGNVPENVPFLTKLYKKYGLEYPVYYYIFDNQFGMESKYYIDINTQNLSSGYLIDSQGKKLQINTDILKDMTNSFKNYLGIMTLEHKVLQESL